MNPRPRSYRRSVYKRSLRFRFARRPARRRPTAGLALLWSPASGEWLSLGSEPVSDAGSRSTGRDRGDALPKLVRQRVRVRYPHLRVFRWFYEANRRPRLAAQPENQPRRNLIAPVCRSPSVARYPDHFPWGLKLGTSGPRRRAANVVRAFCRATIEPMNGVRAIAVSLGVVAVFAAAYGAYLLATLGEEFDPRGRVGIYSLVAAVVIGGIASLTWRRSR